MRSLRTPAIQIPEDANIHIDHYVETISIWHPKVHRTLEIPKGDLIIPPEVLPICVALCLLVSFDHIQKWQILFLYTHAPDLFLVTSSSIWWLF